MSSDEDDADDFEVTDYDMAAAMGQIKRKKRTKKSQIYGIWNDEDSDDDRPSFGFKNSNKKKDYTAPVSFVTGGTKPGSEPKDVPLSSDDDGDVLDPNDDNYEREYLKQKEEPMKDETIKKEIKENPGSNIGKSETATGNLKIGGATKAKGGYSMTPDGGKEKMDKGYAKFAGKSSFAQQMMMKMGWKPGTGLGKHDQGMINPVDVKLRVKGSGLGSHGTERTKQSLIHFPTAERKIEIQKKNEKKAVKGPQWRSSDSNRKKKPVLKYATIEDLKKSGGYGIADSDEEEFAETDLEKPEMKIVDMTGKEQRVITAGQVPSQKARKKNKSESSSDSSSSSSEDEVEKIWACKELEHNLEMLVKNGQNEYLKTIRQQKENENRKEHIKYEKERNKKSIENDEKLLDTLQTVLQLLEKEIDDLDDLYRTTLELNQYQREWESYGVELEIADKRLRPQLTSLLSKWRPVSDAANEKVRDEFARWKKLLPNFYSDIIWTCWMPPVRDDILRRWEPRQQSHIIEFVSLWRGELPSSIWTNVEDQLILPKLTQAVSEWDPINERILISEWLLPWHNILGKTKMYDMVTQIRQRFRQCLRRWEASDNSAKVILTPWKNVWSEVEWNQFMLQNIVPKLEATMSNIVINISTVDTTSIGHIQDWIGLIPSQAMLKLFDEIFYRKWSAAIQAWLKSPNCNLADVASWYRVWYSSLHSDIRSAGVVRDHLSQNLQMMKVVCAERASRMPSSAPPDIPPPPRADADNDEMDIGDDSAPTQDYRSKPSTETIEGPPATFKDLIERRAGQRNIIFMPKGKQHNGKEIYKCGKLSLYVEQGVCFVFDGEGDWCPSSVTKLFNKA